MKSKAAADRNESEAGNAGPSPSGMGIAKGEERTGTARLQEILERISDGFVAFDAELNYIYVNEKAGELLGRRPQDLLGKNFWSEYPEARGTTFADAYVRALETREPAVLEDYYEPFDRWFENRIYPSSNGLTIYFTEITRRKHAEILLAEERNVLEMIAGGESLSQILEAITLKVEARSRDMLCTILLLDADGVHMRHGAAPSMPQPFIRAIDGEPIGPNAGSCGTAAFRREPVIVTDIATDPLWDGYRDAALKHGLRACWSTPIMSSRGDVLGTFAMYYTTPRAPRPSDLNLIDVTTHLASVAIEARQTEQSMQAAQDRLSLAIRSANVGLWDWDLTTNKVYYSPEWKSQLGYAGDEISNEFSEWESRLHPDDVESASETTRKYLEKPYPNYQNEFRLRHKDGSYRWILAQASLLFDVHDRPVRMMGSHIDITERRQAEENLRESEARFRAMADHSPVGIFLTAPDGLSLYSNAVNLRQMGLTAGQAEGTGWQTAIHPDDRVEVFARFTDAVRQGASYQGINRYLHADGRIVWVDVSATPIRGGGHVVGFVGTAIDITQRKHAEDRLRESEERFRHLWEATIEGIAIHDGGILLESNPAILKLLGLSREQVIGRSLFDFAPPEAHAAIRQKIEARDEEPYEVSYMRPDGVRLTLELTGRNALYEGQMRRIVSVRDVTERRRTQESLQESERKFRTLTEFSPVGIFLDDAQGRAIYINERCAELVGLPAEKALQLDWVAAIHPDDRARVTSRWAQAVRQGAPFSEDYRWLHQNGRVVWTHGEIAPVHDANGNVSVYIGTLIDITDRKRAEMEIARLLDESQRRMKEVEALHSIDLAISASMDLRTVLSVLIQQAESLLRADAVDVLLYNADLQQFSFAAGRGFYTDGIQRAAIRFGTGLAGRVGRERRRVLISGDLASQAGEEFSRIYEREGFLAYAGVPLISKGQIKGILEVFRRSPHQAEPEWLNLLETLAGQAAIAVDNAQLLESLQKSNLELAMAYDATIAGWSHAMDLRDKETEGHTQRVTDLTLILASAMNIGESQLRHIRHGALLHDIGKMGVPDDILLKEGSLTEEEWVKMRKHPEFAYEMLSSIHFLKPALDIPYCHHEKWDGTGYPRGLEGEEIPLAARIFAVVDVWDAVTNHRPYRPAWTKEQALEYIREQSGKHFDPQVVEMFLQLDIDQFK